MLFKVAVFFGLLYILLVVLQKKEKQKQKVRTNVNNR